MENNCSDRTVRKPADLMDLAKGKFTQMATKIKANQSELVTVDEMALINRQNSDLLTLQIINTAPAPPDRDITVAFGSPLGVAEEYQNVPLYASLTNFWLDHLNYLTDNQGAQVPFLRLINRRLLRHPIVVKQIEVITDNSAEGQAQATKQLTLVEVPYNSASDSAKRTGAYVSKFTEFTATYLLNKIIPLGDFTGALYTVVADVDVLLNIHIAGISQPTFPVYK